MKKEQGIVIMLSKRLMKYLKYFFAFSLLSLTISGVAKGATKGAGDVTLACKSVTTDAALDFSSLGLNVSASMPVGTVVYSGTVNVTFECALNNLKQFIDGLSGEVYFKRKPIDDGTLGYGLTIYSGYGGQLGTDATSIATGKSVETYALTSGGTVGSYTTVVLSVPYQIVKTSSSMAASTSLRSYVNVFDVGSFVAGKDLKFNFTNIKSGITAKDETCSVASLTNQTVPLGSYSVNKSSGLGSGVGSTSQIKSFNIVLNCEALLSGSFQVMMQFDGTPVSGLNDSGVLELTEKTGSAKNVGVQILDGNNSPISLGTAFNVASFPMDSSVVTVPLHARYYQIGDSITGGIADSSVTYTISYQ